MVIETRDARVTLLHGTDGWVLHKENGIQFRFDVTRCMFSSGNVTERIRMGTLDCSGETIVDLYAGIGYYTLPLLIKAKSNSVHFHTTCAVADVVDVQVIACEWNRHAARALRLNLKENGVEEQCQILEGDCRRLAPVASADRVLLGLLPSSKGGWQTALRTLKSTGNPLHLYLHSTISRWLVASS